MQEAVDLLVSKQDEHGKWKLESTFNGRFQVDIEEKDKASKWVRLNALRVLKRVLWLGISVRILRAGSCNMPPSAEAACRLALLLTGTQCVDFHDDVTTMPCHVKRHLSAR